MAMFGFGLSLLLSADKYQATARIKVENDFNDGNIPASTSQSIYDPYFIQTTFEIIQSQLVLSNVVANLNLNEIWGKKSFKSGPLKTTETMAIIRNHLRLTPILNTKLVAITFESADPNEAAQVANAIAEAYRDYRNPSRRELVKGVQTLQQQFQDEENQISNLDVNVEQLRQKFGIQGAASTNQTSEQQPYWDEKQKLDQKVEFLKLIVAKIEAEKMEFHNLELHNPKASMVQITDKALPPTAPVSPNRFLGGGLTAVGLLSMFFGWRLLKPAARQIG